MVNRGFYKHNRCSDVFIEILKIQWRDAKRIKARVTWWNAGCTGNPWIIHRNQYIEITKDQEPNWVRIYPFEIKKT